MSARVLCNWCLQMVRPDDVHSCFDAKKVADLRDAERAVIDAARAAESTLNGVALSEAHYGGQSPDDLLTLLDTLAALRTLEGPR